MQKHPQNGPYRQPHRTPHVNKLAGSFAISSDRGFRIQLPSELIYNERIEAAGFNTL